MRMKWKAAKKWRLVIGLATISATFVVSLCLYRLSPTRQATGASLELVIAFSLFRSFSQTKSQSIKTFLSSNSQSLGILCPPVKVPQLTQFENESAHKLVSFWYESVHVTEYRIY